MSLINKLERVQRMHQMILHHRTGSPEEFAKKLSISRSQLYKLIRELKTLNAPIIYCKSRQSFRYLHPVEFKCTFENKNLNPIEKRSINGGCSLRIVYRKHVELNSRI